MTFAFPMHERSKADPSVINLPMETNETLVIFYQFCLHLQYLADTRTKQFSFIPLQQRHLHVTIGSRPVQRITCNKQINTCMIHYSTCDSIP